MKTGIDNLLENGASALPGRRIGLLSHRAAVAADGRTTAEILHETGALAALFGPEHGFLGQAAAGEKTASFVHPDWQIPVHSLYGETRKPTPAMLDGLDGIVCDLQDIGVRCYTYLATLRNMMEACANTGIPLLVLDRPIPLPNTVDGPVRETALDSFVAPAALPFVTGLTPGESARWLQRHLFPGLSLAVVPLVVASRAAIRLPEAPRFVRPSPGLPSPEAASVYPMTVFTEALPSIDCGLGTDQAFTVFGMPWLDHAACCATLNAVDGFPGLRFDPQVFVSAREYAGETIPGVKITVTDRDAFQPFSSAMRLLAILFESHGRDTFWARPSTRPAWFDALFGVPALREALLAGRPFTFDPGPARAAREAVLLY